MICPKCGAEYQDGYAEAAETEEMTLLHTILGIFGILVLYRLLVSLYILFQTAV